MAHSIADVALREGRHEAVAHGLDFGAAVLLQRLPCDPFVLAQHIAALRVAEPLHHLSVANDVGEEHRARTGGQRRDVFSGDSSLTGCENLAQEVDRSRSDSLVA